MEGNWYQPYAVHFADNQAVLAGSKRELQRIMDKLNKTSKERGIKTKIMVIAKNKNLPNISHGV